MSELAPTSFPRGSFVGVAAEVAAESARVDSQRKGVLRFISASASRQHPIKRKEGWIFADATEEAPVFLGVCDGVSGVQTMGIPPDELPRELLERCREHIELRAARQPPEHNDEMGYWLMGLLKDAYDESQCLGATTLLIMTLDAGRVVMCNVGDCGAMVLRPDPGNPSRLQVVHRTEPTRYDPHKPKQLARLEGMDVSEVHLVIQGAKIQAVKVHHGDHIVLGSDGLFDNLHDEDILNIVEEHCTKGSAVPQSVRSGYAWVENSPRGPVNPTLPSVAQLEEAADALVGAAIDSVRFSDEDGNVNNHDRPWQTRPPPVGPNGNADDTTAMVAVILEVDDTAAHEEFFYRARSRGVVVEPAQHGVAGFLPACCRASDYRYDEEDGDGTQREGGASARRKQRQEEEEIDEESGFCSIA